MTTDRLLELLTEVAVGRTSPGDALERLAWLPVEPVGAAGPDDVAFARLDHHRGVRQGFPEVVYCPGKTVDQVVDICERLAARGNGFLATRADEEIRLALARKYARAEMNEIGRTVWLPAPDDTVTGVSSRRGTVLIVSAGTADLPVAEEAASTARALGNPVERMYDVGVAGLHRLLQGTEALRRAAVVIAVAGMDGALPSVVGGLVASPVVAVPTSAGYGAAFGGVAALLTMLNSCASGVVVVNIDNGFGAACAATRINARAASVPVDRAVERG